MGVTIHYRGTLDDLARVEEFEDRVLDVVSALGGQATIWRSFGPNDPSRVVRGLLVQMCPGQETLSLLIAPEGQLLNLLEIKQAEQGPLGEAPFCFVKTQFGSLQGHVAVVCLLDALRAEFIKDLEVSDESGYFEHRDPRELARKLDALGSAMLALGDALESSSLSPEAAEDPEILATRILRLSELVFRKLRATGSSGQSPEEAKQNAGGDDPSLEELVRQQSQARRKAELRQERLMRRLEEGRGQGLSTDDAVSKALREAKLDEDGAAESSPDGNSGPRLGPGELSAYLEADYQLWLRGEDTGQGESGFDGEDAEIEEPWLASLKTSESDYLVDDETVKAEPESRHPAQRVAERLYARLNEIGRELTAENGFYPTALNGVGELLGGLVQATGREIDCRSGRAGVIVQLKRALKGLAFCRGGVFGLRSAGVLDEQSHRELQDQLKQILEHLHELLVEAWNE